MRRGGGEADAPRCAASGLPRRPRTPSRVPVRLTTDRKRPVVASRIAPAGRDSAGKGGIGLLAECSPGSCAPLISTGRKGFFGGRPEAVGGLRQRFRRPDSISANHRSPQLRTSMIPLVGNPFSPPFPTPPTAVSRPVGDVALLRKPRVRMYRARAGSQQ